MEDEVVLDTPEKLLGKIDELIVDMTNTQAEVESLRHIETQRDMLQAEVDELHKEVNRLRMKNAELQEMQDGLVTDLSLMETRINELSGTEPF